jgi:hypothetical protein
LKGEETAERNMGYAKTKEVKKKYEFSQLFFKINNN